MSHNDEQVSILQRVGSHGLRIFGLPMPEEHDDQPHVDAEVHDVSE